MINVITNAVVVMFAFTVIWMMVNNYRITKATNEMLRINSHMRDLIAQLETHNG